MLELHETFQIVNAYDRHKEPAKLTVRKLTLEELKLSTWYYGQTFWFIDTKGQARQCRVGSSMKRWKRDPDRLECSFKYGLYESNRWDTQEMLQRLLIEV